MTTAIEMREKPKRQLRFRLSLRLLMLAILVFGLALGWKVNKANRTRRAIEQIHELNGSAYYDYQFAAGEDVDPPEPRWLQRLLGPEYFHEIHQVSLFQCKKPDLSFLDQLHDLRFLDLSYCDLDDTQLVHVKSLKQLRKLDLWDLKIGDSGIENLVALSRLEELHLVACQISDASAPQIGKLKHLRKLSLNADRLTDTGLSALSGLSALKYLDVSSKQSGDLGLSVIANFRQLEQLKLHGFPYASDAGLRFLRDLKHLELLELISLPVKDPAIESVIAVQSLTHLSLKHIEVGDIGLSRLTKLPNLGLLNLEDTRLSDEGLRSFATIRSASHFLVKWNSAVTQEGLRRLQSELPNAFVEN